MMKILSFLLPHPLYKKILRIEEFIEREKKYSDAIPLSKKIWLWRHGFNSLHMRLFNLTPDNLSNYLSNKAYEQMHPINGIYSKFIDNKAFLPFVLPDYQKYAFDVFISISKGRIIYSNQNQTNLPLEELLKNLLISKTLVCKPVNLGGGEGFMIVNKENFRQIAEKIIKSKKDYVITEKIKQHEYASNIFPDSVNTIRLLLMRDIDTRELFIAKGFHRFGTVKSKPVDNVSSGGILADFNLENGILMKVLDYKNRKKFRYLAAHPETGKIIEGVEIPRWIEIKKIIIDLFSRMEWFVYGGIDVVVTDEGFRILEINSLPGINAMQMFEPSLLSDERVAKFYKFYSKH